MSRRQTRHGPGRNGACTDKGLQHLIWAAGLALGLLPGVSNALPYYSFVEASAVATTDLGPVSGGYESESGSGVSSASANSFGYPAPKVAWGNARSRSDPASGLLKAEVSGVYSYHSATGQPFSWEVCWAGSCAPWTSPTLPASSAKAYARSVWQVVSDELPAGTPVDLYLTLSLSGSFWGNPDTQGVAVAGIRAWLNKPDTLMLLSGVDPLDDERYGAGITNWWRDVGPAPNLEILASNKGPSPFEKTVYSNVPEDNDGGLPVFRPPLPQVVVGDILVLETELVAGVSLVNDGFAFSPYDTAGADFYDTGGVGITVTTQGVQLVPVPEPQAIWMMLAGLGVVIGRIAHRATSRSSTLHPV